MNRDAIKTEQAAVTTAEANFGSAIPQNMRRFIYRVKFVNEHNGANMLTLGKRENGAGATTTVDVFQAAVQYEQQTDPEELKEDSAPLYTIEGTGSTGDSYVRAVTDNGNGYMTLWYEDAPA